MSDRMERLDRISEKVRESGSTYGWDRDFVLTQSQLILAFGVGVLLVIAALLAWTRHNPIDILRVCSLPLTIIAAVYLIVVGFSEDQIYPVIGLLGAIAGYVLGNIQNPPQERDSRNERQ